MRRPPTRLALVRRHPKFLRPGRPKRKAIAPNGFVGTKIEPALHDQLIAAANRDGVTLSAFVRRLIEIEITKRFGSTKAG